MIRKLLPALALLILNCDRDAPPPRARNPAPTLFRMAGGSATGNALEFLLPDTPSAPEPPLLLQLPGQPVYGHGPWQKEPVTDTAAKPSSP